MHDQIWEGLGFLLFLHLRLFFLLFFFVFLSSSHILLLNSMELFGVGEGG